MIISLPPCTDPKEKSECLGTLAPIVTLQFEPVGRTYEIHYNSRARTTSYCESDDEDEDEETVVAETPEEIEYLKNLDPKDWKDQDHYRVLGLQDKRYKATEKDIKAAFRRKVLRHHPDKRAAKGEKIDNIDKDYFSCITRANDLLSNPKLRLSYDSVDSQFDDAIPSVNESSKKKFFETFGPVFESNARWSIKPNVPVLGDKNATEEQVDDFYNFWYNFETWREYSYLDEEDKEKGENRDERRWIEKENKAQRQKLKKDEVKRIRQLVDNARNCDPRIRRFAEEARKKKEDVKKRRQDEARAKKEAEEKERREREETARLEKEQKEREEQEQRTKEKKLREAAKREQKKQKKLFESLCAERNNFAEIGSADLVKNLECIDQITKILTIEELTAVNEEMSTSDNRQSVFIKAVNTMNDKLHKEKMETIQSSMKSVGINGATNGTPSVKDWSNDEIQLLIKAVNLFPAGTSDRWEVVAAYIAQHSDTKIKRTAKDVLGRAKSMQKSGLGTKQDGGSCTANLKPAAAGEETVAGIDENNISSFSEVSRAWTNEEQKLLEQALKTFPVSLGTERWDKISGVLPNRTKKECMKRYKEIVETVRAKKAAIDAAKAK